MEDRCDLNPALERNGVHRRQHEGPMLKVAWDDGPGGPRFFATARPMGCADGTHERAKWGPGTATQRVPMTANARFVRATRRRDRTKRSIGPRSRRTGFHAAQSRRSSHNVGDEVSPRRCTSAAKGGHGRDEHGMPRSCRRCRPAIGPTRVTFTVFFGEPVSGCPR